MELHRDTAVHPLDELTGLAPPVSNAKRGAKHGSHLRFGHSEADPGNAVLQDDATLARARTESKGENRRSCHGEQTHDFACGELRSRFFFAVDGAEARGEVLTYCSRTRPTLALQEVVMEVDRRCELALGVAVDPAGLVSH